MIILTIIAVLAAVAGVVQLVRVFELTWKLKGDNQTSVDFAENRTRGRLWGLFVLAYFGFFIYIAQKYSPFMLPEAASEHGAVIDTVLNFNFLIIIAVFVITHLILAYFTGKYYWRPGKRAEFVTHNNKLELLWTTVPAIVLAVIIIYGLTAWNDITSEPSEDAIRIELYSKQFDWTARYAGSDNQLGEANFNFIGGINALGLVTKESIETRIAELEEEIAGLEAEVAEAPEGGLKEEEASEKLDLRKRQLSKIYVHQYKYEQNAAPYNAGLDDKLVKVEFHIPVGKEVFFQFRSQDVIHSAYMPHFRAQMNTVPGEVTSFKFTPTITTADMKLKTGNPDFNYILLCNKVCGAAHYNMQMDIIVESEADYNKWLGEQKTFAAVNTTTSDLATISQ